jgi:hypothetical protein
MPVRCPLLMATRPRNLREVAPPCLPWQEWHRGYILYKAGFLNHVRTEVAPTPQPRRSKAKVAPPPSKPAQVGRFEGVLNRPIKKALYPTGPPGTSRS